MANTKTETRSQPETKTLVDNRLLPLLEYLARVGRRAIETTLDLVIRAVGVASSPCDVVEEPPCPA